VPVNPVPIVKALLAVAVTVVLPPKLTKEPLMVMLELVNWLFPMPLSVPPSVRLPVLVTVPVSVMPFTEPVPDTLVTYVPAGCLLLNVFQSVLVKYPLTEVVAAGILIAGVAPPLDTTGDVPETLVTVPTLMLPPRLVDVPLIVIALFANCALVMVPLKSVVGMVALAVSADVPLPFT
jgi:hypothetical protein